MSKVVSEKSTDEAKDDGFLLQQLIGDVETVGDGQAKTISSIIKRCKEKDRCADGDCSDCEQHGNTDNCSVYQEHAAKYGNCIDDEIVPETWGYNYRCGGTANNEKMYIVGLTKKEISRFVTLGTVGRKHIWKKGHKIYTKKQWKLLHTVNKKDRVTFGFQVYSNGKMKITEIDIANIAIHDRLLSSNDIMFVRCTCKSKKICSHVTTCLLAISDTPYEIPALVNDNDVMYQYDDTTRDITVGSVVFKRDTLPHDFTTPYDCFKLSDKKTDNWLHCNDKGMLSYDFFFIFIFCP